ncbi:hypothetical protein L208DRAFT_1221180, partial [Tricholoma matsutake]
PVLTAGRMTIPVIHIFENMCRCFFQNKKLPEDEQVLSIIYNFESLAVQVWITTHHDCLIALMFVEFFTEFKNKFLPANWKDDLVTMQITMQSSQAFLTWMENVHEANAELAIAGSDYYIAKDKLRTHFNLNKHEEWLKIAQASACANTKNTASRGGNNQIANAGSAGMAAASTSNITTPGVLTNTTNTQQPATLKLTQTEHDLLRTHHGCFHCRLFYAGHFTLDCPLGTNERPTQEACKNITTAAALKAKAAFEAKGSGFAATVFEEEEDSNEFDMTEEEVNEYVLNLSLPSHMWWECCIDTPMTCALTPIRALIDHGSPPVLISSEIVDVLGLARWKLFKPFSVSGAFADGKRSVDSSLTEYCKLHLQSPNSDWKAKVVNAIISPNLQMDIILGLDFLTKNKIVVDAELRTAIMKDDDYDLLNPPEVAKPKVVEAPHLRQITETKRIKSGCVQVKHIEELAASKVLESLDSMYKERYADRFPTDIPHASELPTDIYHHIEVIPGSPISVGCAYSCPRKYREGWK